MKICFVYMNTERNIGRGAGYVAASIPTEHSVVFIDTFKTAPVTVLKKVLQHEPDMLMVSSMTLTWNIAVKVMQSVKRHSPKLPVLVGGIHPTIMKEKILEEYRCVDYICVGEGESFVREFLTNYGTSKKLEVDNLIYRKGGKIHSNPVRPPEDLATLPKFPWSSFSTVVSAGMYRLLYVTASRGCPFNCTFCCNGVYLDLYKSGYIRRRPVEHVLDELAELKDNYEFGEFYFGDDMMFTDVDYVKELATGIKEKIGRPYGCMGRCEYINEDLADHLKSTGCVYVSLGIECGDENFRREYLNRHMTNDQIVNAFKLLKDRGIRTAAFNMIGYPVDYDDDLCQATAKINKEINPDLRQVTWFYPFPGTKLYDYCVDKNLLTKDLVRTFHAASIVKMHQGKGSPVRYLEKFL